MLISSLTNRRPLVELSICHYNRLLSAMMSFLLESIVCAATEKLKEASGWHKEVIYTPLARRATHCTLVVSASRVWPLELVAETDFLSSTSLRFLH